MLKRAREWAIELRDLGAGRRKAQSVVEDIATSFRM